MISAVTTYRVAEGMEQSFETAFAQLQQQVIAGESGTVGFQLYCAAENSRLYKIVAHFRDNAAMEEHNSGLFLGAIAKQLFALCEDPPEVEVLRAV
ncbi:MAG: antibiotic biosynthesis monooxygenase [Chromatiales bacterium]|nr:MAG: antibiotic biosynthesis monooxygenase [Chromatiales bacterium]